MHKDLHVVLPIVLILCLRRSSLQLYLISAINTFDVCFVYQTANKRERERGGENKRK